VIHRVGVASRYEAVRRASESRNPMRSIFLGPGLRRDDGVRRSVIPAQAGIRAVGFPGHGLRWRDGIRRSVIPAQAGIRAVGSSSLSR
jgi:hypothetical protein